MAEETICLLWRCRGCGAARLGTLEEKPERCPSCGGSDLEFVAED
jgi:rubrerythrin